jgi:hypothetical protein
MLYAVILCCMNYTPDECDPILCDPDEVRVSPPLSPLPYRTTPRLGGEGQEGSVREKNLEYKRREERGGRGV